jgi:hypothetical protein
MTTTTDIGWAVAFARSAAGVGTPTGSGYAGPTVPDRGAASEAGWVETPAGADLAVVGDVVVKLHHTRTDVGDLRRRLVAVRDEALADVFVQPLAEVAQAPDGRWATAWPKVEVLTEDDETVPWARAGRLLAELHSAPAAVSLPRHGGPARVERALNRISAAAHPAAPGLARLGTRLLDELAPPATRHTAGRMGHQATIVHGDWHLGQLARPDGDLRLLDVDDLGLGDPAWDLGRPAGFWAAGLLDDTSWQAFLAGYRDAAGPAVPADGDPWPGLDLAARCAVFVAAVRAVTAQPAHSTAPADSLLEVCDRM